MKDRLTNIPRYDPDSINTTQARAHVPHDITYLFHGHTHRGHHSIQWVQNEYGKWEVRHYIGVPPTYVDPNVRKPFAGWVSLLEIDGEAQVFMHALTN